jgi:hypothetical protein
MGQRILAAGASAGASASASAGASAILVAALLCLAAGAAAVTPGEADVRYLLDRVAASDCTFIRNGKRYAGADAARHLQRKYDYATRKYGDITAEQFIEHVATKSSWTGKYYLVTCPPQSTEQRSADWLRQMLEDRRAP